MLKNSCVHLFGCLKVVIWLFSDVPPQRGWLYSCFIFSFWLGFCSNKLKGKWSYRGTNSVNGTEDKIYFFNESFLLQKVCSFRHFTEWFFVCGETRCYLQWPPGSAPPTFFRRRRPGHRNIFYLFIASSIMPLVIFSPIGFSGWISPIILDPSAVGAQLPPTCTSCICQIYFFFYFVNVGHWWPFGCFFLRKFPEYLFAFWCWVELHLDNITLISNQLAPQANLRFLETLKGTL